jgi:chromate transporter
MVTAFAEGEKGVPKLGEIHAQHAHVVAVDPQSRHVYLPLQNAGSRPVLRIAVPTKSPHGKRVPMSPADTVRRVPIRDLVLYYLRLGAIGFGGPVALVGQMEQELVRQRHWLTREEFREGMAVCQSLPGPLAIQVAIFISYIRGGFWGAWAGGWAFILPNFLFVAASGALYVYLGDLPSVKAIFYGVSPAVIALIVYSCYRLIKLGMEDPLQWVLAASCFIVTVALQAEVALLFIVSGAIGIAYYGTFFRRWLRGPTVPLLAAAPAMAGFPAAPAGSILSQLLVFFLKAGSLTFGSGLVIVPFLEKGLVQQTGWLTGRQFLVAVAMGMLSPGPVVITATFVGYLVAGLWGSVVSTIGIFLPSFLLVLIVSPILIRHRDNPNVQGFVKGAYAAAIGTILGAGALLGKIAIGDWLTALVGLVSLVALVRWKISNPLLVAATAVIGLVGFALLKPTWVLVK